MARHPAAPPRRALLAFDTSGPHCAAALVAFAGGASEEAVLGTADEPDHASVGKAQDNGLILHD